MAILFSQQRKTTRYLIIGLGVALFILILFWFFSSRKTEDKVLLKNDSLPNLRIESAKIDFQNIKKEFLEAFVPYQFVLPFESNVGRDNPFASSTEPISTSTSTSTSTNPSN